MYNIDFRVSGILLSIPVCLNDTLDTLISRMTELQPFRKVSKQRLQEKLILCIKKILQLNTIDQKIKLKFNQLIKKAQKIETPLCLDRQNKRKQFLNNNTFVNILQQSSINASQYLVNPCFSQPKFKRNYLPRDNLNQDQNQETSNGQQKLIYKYGVGKQQIYSKKNGYEKIKINDILCSQKKHNYLKQMQEQERRQQKIYSQKNLQLSTQSYNRQVKPQWKQINVGKPSYQESNHYRTISDNFRHNQKVEIIRESNLEAVKQQKYYNPVPRLNELIQKSRSLGRIVQKQFKNSQSINFDHQRNKQINPNKSLSKNWQQSPNKNILQKRKSVGRIQHIQEKLTNYQGKSHQRKELGSRQYQRTPLSTKLQNKLVYQNKTNYNSKIRSEYKKYQPKNLIKETISNYNLSLNQNTHKKSTFDLKRQIPAKYSRQNIPLYGENHVQNKPKHSQTKLKYSYL